MSFIGPAAAFFAAASLSLLGGQLFVILRLLQCRRLGVGLGLGLRLSATDNFFGALPGTASVCTTPSPTRHNSSHRVHERLVVRNRDYAALEVDRRLGEPANVSLSK